MAESPFLSLSLDVSYRNKPEALKSVLPANAARRSAGINRPKWIGQEHAGDGDSAIAWS